MRQSSTPTDGIGLAGGLRLAVSAALLLAAACGVARYPLPSWTLGVPLLAYAALLWWRPSAFLLVLPMVLPAWDLGIWTGWMMLGEADFFVVVTVAILLVRSPPARSDWWPGGVAGWVLGGFVTAWVIAAVVGWTSPLGAPRSDNAFLRPDNALRLFKGLVEALVLLPFLRQRRDATVWLGWGMAIGIVAVTAAVVVERALFTSVWDFTGAYRVAGPFSSMRVGGGHIGAYLALALPMTICLTRLRPGWIGALSLMLTGALGGYSLAVTFARTAYAAGAMGLAITGVGWLWTAGPRVRVVIGGIVPLVLVIAVVLATMTGMRQRFAESPADLVTRENNWRAGLAVRDTGVLPTLFGMGLGTYQRTMLMRSGVNRPSDLVLRGVGAGRYVEMRVETPFYLGQKVPVPASGKLHLTLFARSYEEKTTLGVLLCDKVLLYSDNCRGGSVTLPAGAAWQPIRLDLPVDGLGRGAIVHRPVELSLFGGPAGHEVDVRNVGLQDDAGREVLVNGGFANGLDRWIFTDDSHVSWRMLNQYLMLWFETGALGLAAYVAFAVTAMAGGVRAAWSGSVAGAGVAGSIGAFLVSGVADNVLEAPRVGTLFFLVCLCGLLLWEGRGVASDCRVSVVP